MLRFLTLAGLTIALAGCDGSPKTYRVTGTVTWQGTPVADGQINFIAVDGLTQPASTKLVNGAYDLRATAGAKTVQVYAQRSKGFDKVMKQEVFEGFMPPEYNAKSVLTFDVQPNDDNVFDLALPPKK